MISENHFRVSSIENGTNSNKSKHDDLRQSLGVVGGGEDEMYLFQRMKSFVRK